MKHPLRAAAISAGALLCLSASQAFAELDFVAAEDGGSWFLSYTLTTNATHQFSRIEVTIANGTVMTFGSETRGVGAQDLNFDGRPDGTSSNFFTHDAFAVIGTPASNLTRDFSDPSWSEEQVPNNTSTFGVATGNPTPSLTYWLYLGSPVQNRTSGTRYTIAAYNSVGHLIATGQALYKQYTSGGVVVAVDEFSSVQLLPVPAALWTGLPMLGGMILFIRRRKNQAL